LQDEIKIGNTPLVRLTKLEADGYAQIFAKLEGQNPGGSIKDRVALAIIESAEKQGALKKGGTVVEATSGNTGIGLALVCRAKGYKAVIVMPSSMSLGRRRLIASYGAELVLTDGADGMLGAVRTAKEIARKTPNSILANQFENPACVAAHYVGTAAELYAQMEGNIDIFAAGVGTGGTLTGIGRFLKERNPQVRVAAVEPASSPLLSCGRAGAHGIQGIGANFIPKILDRTVYDEVIAVTDEDAVATQKRLQALEGLSVGISSGAAVWAAQALARREENRGKRIAVILPDEGSRYEIT
jgi:cysteine synthase A